MADPAGYIGGRDDAVADLERLAFAVSHSAADRGDASDIFVAANQRVGEIALVRSASILFALPAKRVLVGAANPGITDFHKDSPRARIRHGKFMHFDASR